jgi:hypothetical protein
MVNFAGASGTGISSAPVVLVCPTRDRPAGARRLIDEWGRTGVCSDLVFCVDDDDPQMGAYTALMTRRAFHRGIITWLTGPRRSLCAWTDWVTSQVQDRYQAVMSIGDDHVPQTGGFDLKLLDAAVAGGFAYGDDGITHQPSEDWPEPHCLPTACLITTGVCRALGRFCLPGAAHMFTDAYWMLLAERAGCRHYLPDVKVTHMHPAASRAAMDQTYRDGAASWDADQAAYETWKACQLAADVTTVREVTR